MKTLMVSYLVALVVMAILDALWLGVVSREFYKARLGHLLLDKPIWSVAILFYLVHAAGIAIFPVQLALGAGTWRTSRRCGAGRWPSVSSISPGEPRSPPQ
jgi:uncharacterized membrane protein